MIHIEFDLDYTGHKQITEEDFAPSETVEDAIIRSAGESLLSQTITKSEVRWDGIKQVARLRDEAIRERLAPIIEEAFSQPIQRTNEYGQPRGEPVTMHEIITEMVTTYLTKQDGYSRETPLKKFIHEEIDRIFQAEMKVALAAAKQEMLDAMKAKGAEVMAQTIQQMAAGR